MHITIQRETLLRALAVVMRACGNGAMPILANVLMESKDACLRLTCTNLDTTIIVSDLAADVYAEQRDLEITAARATDEAPDNAGGGLSDDARGRRKRVV